MPEKKVFKINYLHANKGLKTMKTKMAVLIAVMIYFGIVGNYILVTCLSLIHTIA